MTKYYTPKCFHCDRGDVTLADDSTEDADKYVEASTYNADVSHWRQRAEATEVECLRWTDSYKSQYEDLARNRTALAEMTRRAEAAERERDRWQEDSMRQAQTINRMAAAAEDRNEVDANRHAYTEARIAQLEAALRKELKKCPECHGSGRITSWDMNNGPPMDPCYRCADLRSALRPADHGKGGGT